MGRSALKNKESKLYSLSDIGKRITVDGISEEDLLTSNQEEADGQIILVLHAITAANRGAHKIAVESPDTDVLVVLLHHCVAIRSEEIYLLTGRGGKHQINASIVHLMYASKLYITQHDSVY